MNWKVVVAIVVVLVLGYYAFFNQQSFAPSAAPAQNGDGTVQGTSDALLGLSTEEEASLNADGDAAAASALSESEAVSGLGESYQNEL